MRANDLHLAALTQSGWKLVADDHNKLREALDRLQSELDELRMVNPGAAAHLDETIGEVRATLDGKALEQHRQRSLTERLRDAVLQYEASHPSLALNLSGLVDALANMGI
jgi:hypothetical protein